VNRIEGHPKNEFTLADAREAFLAAMDAAEDGRAFAK
jgi:hypothetical protein